MTTEDIKMWFDGNYSATRQAEMEKWFVENIDSPELDSALEEILQRCTPADRERTRKAFADTCRRLGLTPPERLNHRNWFRRVAIPAAAAMAVGIVAGALIFGSSALKPAEPEWVEVYASAGETDTTVMLPDSSTLRLQPASVLIYDATSFADNRQVYLQGGAYAEVTSDASNPFSIRCNGATVTVLGTKFDLSSYAEDSEMEVMLYEGAVEVSSNFAGIADTVRLEPGEVVKYDKISGSRSVLGIRGLGGHGASEFYFIDRNLSDIVNELERHFGVNIVVENDDLAAMRFYAIFVNGENLDQILDGLNSSGKMEIRRFADHTIAIR